MKGDIVGLTTRFWKEVVKFYRAPEEATIGEFASVLEINISDGFFYGFVLPKLIEHEILSKFGTSDRYYLGRRGIIYKVNVVKLDEFIVRFNPIINLFYQKRVKTREIELDIV